MGWKNKKPEFPVVIDTGYEFIRARNESDFAYAWTRIQDYYSEQIRLRNARERSNHGRQEQSGIEP